MRKHGIIFYLGLLAAFACVVCLFVFIYALKLRDVLEENLLAGVQETARHDKRAIETNVSFFLEQLKGIDKRLAQPRSKTLKDLQGRLNNEIATTAFTDLFLLGADGRIYAGNFVIHEPPRKQSESMNLGQLFGNSQTMAAVTIYNGPEDIPGLRDGTLIYGIRLRDFVVSGERMEALFGIAGTNFFQEHLIAENFVLNGEAFGFSAVIDRSGNFIVGPPHGPALDDANSFFATVSDGDTSLPAESIREKMRLGDTFDLHYTGPHGDRIIYLTPLQNAGDAVLDWYLAISVSNKMIESRQLRLELMAFALLGMVLISLLALTAYVLLTRHRIYNATEAIKVRSEFLSNMSHEIRTPLNGLIGLNYLLSTHIEERERLPQLKLWLAKSKNLSAYLLALINDILDVSSLQSGKIDINEAPISLDAMLDDICFMQSGNAEAGEVRIKLEKSLDYPWIYGDEVRIKQILTNILGNAVKFTPKGGEVTLSVRQRALPDGRIETTYACADTGKGMSAEFLKHIFDPFMQENRSTSDLSLRGTGLGMTISHELALALGGDIDVKSTPGKGSVFSVRLPGRQAEPQQEDEDAEARKARLARVNTGQSGDARTSLNVLLVEDAEFNAEFIMELLQEEGFHAVHAENGKVALDIFSNSEPFEFDVILMDMQMPVMDGCEATAAIRRLNRPDAESVWVYACTANTFRQDMDRAMASGMNDFLTKPIDIKVFLQKLNSRERLKHEAENQAAERAGANQSG